MRKTFLALLGAFIIGLAVIAVPAHAVPPPDNIGTPINCHSKAGVEAGDNGEYRVRICSTFHWRLQNDGTGVYVESMNIWVDEGCGDLESGTPIGGLHVAIGSEDRSITTDGQSVSSMNDCSAFRDLELRGQDLGSSLVDLNMDVNVDTASDHAATHSCIIKPSNPDDCWTWHN